jgi:CheY-like chemotaxis protein
MAQLKSRDGTVGLAISGYGMENDIETSLAAGFSEHLVKPVKAPRLREAIAVLIESRA